MKYSGNMKYTEPSLQSENVIGKSYNQIIISIPLTHIYMTAGSPGLAHTSIKHGWVKRAL
jgi:hypothetical protein